MINIETLSRQRTGTTHSTLRALQRRVQTARQTWQATKLTSGNLSSYICHRCSPKVGPKRASRAAARHRTFAVVCMQAKYRKPCILEGVAFSSTISHRNVRVAGPSLCVGFSGSYDGSHLDCGRPSGGETGPETLLKERGGWDVIAEAADGLEAVEMADRLVPDVCAGRQHAENARTGRMPPDSPASARAAKS